MENLREAFLLAVRGKQAKEACIRFRENLDAELTSLSSDLLSGRYHPGEYHRFKVYDPKERIICAAPFRDRVLQHAMMRVCHSLFERFQTESSFASRPERGTYKALEQAQRHCRKYSWWVKLDVKKFFDSISHNHLYWQLQRMVKDPLLLAYWQELIAGYDTAPGKGLPVGNLCSQYWANHYMAQADHYALEILHASPMVRYMDDVVMWGNDRNKLAQKARQYIEYVHSQLQLEMHPMIMNRTCYGLPFLGYVVYSHGLHLCQRSRHRWRIKCRKLEQKADDGCISQHDCMLSFQSMLAFTDKTNYRERFRRASNRVNRGGSWNNNASNCRVANRNNNTPTNSNNNLGLRLALQLSRHALEQLHGEEQKTYLVHHPTNC